MYALTPGWFPRTTQASDDTETSTSPTTGTEAMDETPTSIWLATPPQDGEEHRGVELFFVDVGIVEGPNIAHESDYGKD